MQSYQELIDELYRERVLRARAMAPEERALEGIRLFERSCRRMVNSIRREFPDADETQVDAILSERLRSQRCLEDNRPYRSDLPI